eukprot:gene36562-44353_t
MVLQLGALGGAGDRGEEDSVGSNTSGDDVRASLPLLDWEKLTAVNASTVPMSSNISPATPLLSPPLSPTTLQNLQRASQSASDPLAEADASGADPDLLSLFAALNGGEAPLLSAVRHIAGLELLKAEEARSAGGQEETVGSQEARRRRLGRGRSRKGRAGTELMAEEAGEQNMLAWGVLKILCAWHLPPLSHHTAPLLPPPDTDDGALEQDTEVQQTDEQRVGGDGEYEDWGEQQEGDDLNFQESAGVAEKSWLARPAAYQVNIFAQQVQERVVHAPLYSPVKYSLGEEGQELKIKGRDAMEEIGPPILIRPVPDLSKSFKVLPSPQIMALTDGQVVKAKKVDPLLVKTRKGVTMNSSRSAPAIEKVDEQLRRTLTAFQRKKK